MLASHLVCFTLNELLEVNKHWNLQVNVKVLDVDEPPVFSQLVYYFTVEEERLGTNFGTISARDPDRANKGIR